MKRETLYFDTSVLSAYYDERAKERRDATITFWENESHNYNEKDRIFRLSKGGQRDECPQCNLKED